MQGTIDALVEASHTSPLSVGPGMESCRWKSLPNITLCAMCRLSSLVWAPLTFPPWWPWMATEGGCVPATAGCLRAICEYFTGYIAIKAGGEQCTNERRVSVQFVPYNRFVGYPDALTRETLAEIPKQLCQYMKVRGVAPNPALPPTYHLFAEPSGSEPSAPPSTSQPAVAPPAQQQYPAQGQPAPQGQYAPPGYGAPTQGTAPGQQQYPPQYGAPPQGQYPSQGQYPPQGYGAPPQGQYPPQYGAAPAQGQYPPQHGAPQQGAHPGAAPGYPGYRG
jgi:hypothetical protein